VDAMAYIGSLNHNGWRQWHRLDHHQPAVPLLQSPAFQDAV